MSNVMSLPTPPAGFKLEYFCACGMGCTPDDVNTEENCEIEGSVYSGPGVHLNTNTGTQVNSQWSAKDGITFHVSNHGFTSDAENAEYVEKPWTREQIEHLPAMIRLVLAKIDGDSNE